MAGNFLMKGKVYGERKHLLQFPVYAEVKYDEIRLHVKAARGDQGYVRGVDFLSYAGKPLHNLEMWESAFCHFFYETGLNHLDLGVEVNGNFNDSYRWVRSAKGIPGEKFDKATGKKHPALLPSMLRFYLFDVPEYPEEFWARKEKLDKAALRLAGAMQSHAPWPTDVFRPEGEIVADEAALDAMFNKVRERGLEGLMVKDLRGKYISGEAHRSDWWLKMKPESEADGKIVGLNRAISIHGEPLDRVGSVDVLLEDGSTASPAGIEHDLGRDMWLNPTKYLGRWIEFKFMERDRQGGYRHPSFTRFREDKA